MCSPVGGSNAPPKEAAEEEEHAVKFGGQLLFPQKWRSDFNHQSKVSVRGKQ